MQTIVIWSAIVAATCIVLFLAVSRKMNGPRPAMPPELKPGSPLPDFPAVDENGKAVNSRQLRGAPAVILFVRGNWCPFCTRQVEDLTRHYKEIVALGAKLVFITPKPLQTTRRVAEFFNVEFDFWLDESLALSRRFGLVQASAVPQDHRKEYGEDTVWPASLVVDAAGVIRYTHLSKFIFDRPQPGRLLAALRKFKASG
ncbi:MAG: peroxiredoxin family protein [Gammaproteobacteria bacterium]|nr:peroxiredoxin family protein [Gammaproteobacteria bacterium]MDH4315535.1 peroxiredoxin family protein [Gammaproteobacteria bacterium]MDH5215516.1 peroxiredoxin family protein [Gammaproteobacteria bacterium]